MSKNNFFSACIEGGALVVK